MRVLTINAPVALASNLQRRANTTEGMKLMIADGSVPLGDDFGNVRFLKYSSRWKVDFAAIARLRKSIRDFQPDIVHSFLPRSLSQTVLATIGMRKPPKIISFYGITRVPSWREPADWISYLSPKVSMHACESNAVKNALMQGGIRASKCEVIYNCVETETSLMPRKDLLAKFQIAPDAFVIGTVATIRPVKGIDVMLRALIQVTDIQNWIAIIAGPIKDPAVVELVKDPRLHGRLRMLGYVDNASTLMRGMDLFVMPSRKEGLCRALLEAMGQSVCPIVSNAGGMKEVVRDGVDGVVFPSEDNNALALAIRRLHSAPDQISRLGKSAMDRVEAMCAPSVVGDRVMEMYQRLAA